MIFSFPALARTIGLTPKALIAVAMVAGVLLIGTVLRIVTTRGIDSAKRREGLGSLLVWWVGLLLVVVTASGGVGVGIVVFGVISSLGLREYFRMIDRLVPDPTGRTMTFLTVPITYAAVWFNSDLWFALSVVVLGLMLLTASLLAAGKTKGYLITVGSLGWGSILLAYFLSHAVRLLSLPDRSNHVGGAAGWFIYLVVITECDDIFQALWGRRFGKHKITPQVSPHKSLEGLVGGVASTVVIGIILAPWLTPLAEPWGVEWNGQVWKLPYVGAVAACLLLSIVGFLGDLNMSAIKRDAGIKDTGHWLPGQGGILDRIDSLTFTAPTFYYFVKFLYS